MRPDGGEAAPTGCRQPPPAKVGKRRQKTFPRAPWCGRIRKRQKEVRPMGFEPMHANILGLKSSSLDQLGHSRKLGNNVSRIRTCARRLVPKTSALDRSCGYKMYWPSRQKILLGCLAACWASGLTKTQRAKNEIALLAATRPVQNSPKAANARGGVPSDRCKKLSRKQPRSSDAVAIEVDGRAVAHTHMHRSPERGPNKDTSRTRLRHSST